MARRLALLVVLLALPAGADEAREGLDRGRNEFEYGRYQEAINTLRSLLYPSLRLTDIRDIREVRTLLGVSYFFEGKAEEARQEFERLLNISPDARLDPLLYPPPAVELFEEVKRSLKEKLDVIRVQLREEERRRRQEEVERRAAATTVYFEKRVEVHNRALCFLPFGLGQFQNNHQVKAIGFLTAQAASLLTNIISYIVVISLAGDGGFYLPGDKENAEAAQVSQFVSLGAFGAAYIWSVIDGLVYFEPQTSQYIPIPAPPVVPGPKAPQDLSRLAPLAPLRLEAQARPSRYRLEGILDRPL